MAQLVAAFVPCEAQSRFTIVRYCIDVYTAREHVASRLGRGDGDPGLVDERFETLGRDQRHSAAGQRVAARVEVAVADEPSTRNGTRASDALRHIAVRVREEDPLDASVGHTRTLATEAAAARALDRDHVTGGHVEGRFTRNGLAVEEVLPARSRPAPALALRRVPPNLVGNVRGYRSAPHQSARQNRISAPA